MLREQVLREWNNCQTKILNFQKAIEFLANQTSLESPLPAFPLGHNTIRRSLDHWTSPEYSVKLDQHKDRIMSNQSLANQEHLSLLQLSYADVITMFKELTEGWKRERDYRNSPSDGPTIEEVD